MTEVFYESKPVTLPELTIEFFEENARIAKEKGFTCWGTVTNKTTDPWLTHLVFYPPLEKE